MTVPKLYNTDFAVLCLGLHSQQMVSTVSPRIAKLLSESLYVDDFLGGAQALDQRISTGSDNTKGNIVKVLRINWDKQRDCFFFDYSELVNYVNTLPPTKRSLLKVSAKVFDPLGLLSPFSVQAKMLFQKLCFSKKDWDENIEGEALHYWKHLTHNFEKLSHMKVLRYYFCPNEEILRHELHGFSNASEKAYVVAVYLRTVYRDDCAATIQLIASKSRVAPIKKQSIPCLELLGATTLARLLNLHYNQHSPYLIHTTGWIISQLCAGLRMSVTATVCAASS